MLGENSLSAERTPISATNVESISIPVITLEGGDPVVLRLVFQVLHHKNDSLPDKLAFLEMVKLAIFCEKYGLREALKTWATIWSKAFPLAKMTKPGFEDWLLVLYVFKLPDCLAFSDGLARRLCELKNGQLYVKSECGGKLLNDHLPESVVRTYPYHLVFWLKLLNHFTDYLTEVRACLVGSVRDVMERIQVSYMTHPLCRTSSVCTESYKPKDCDSLQIGDFCQQMYLKRIWHEKFWRQSFSEIVMILISFNKRVLPKRLTRFLDARHSHCSWTGKLKEEIARI